MTERKLEGLRVFLSYRREDCPVHAERLYERLTDEGAEAFFDIDSIPLGSDFVDHIEREVASCDLMIVVIGDDWMASDSESGESRLEDPRDWVRIEIRTALERDIHVIPALMERAELPTETELPEDLSRLARRNGIALRDQSWRRDVEPLVEALAGFIAGDVKAPPTEQEPVVAPDQEPPVPQRDHWTEYDLYPSVNRLLTEQGFRVEDQVTMRAANGTRRFDHVAWTWEEADLLLRAVEVKPGATLHEALEASQQCADYQAGVPLVYLSAEARLSDLPQLREALEERQLGYIRASHNQVAEIELEPKISERLDSELHAENLARIRLEEVFSAEAGQEKPRIGRDSRGDHWIVIGDSSQWQICGEVKTGSDTTLVSLLAETKGVGQGFADNADASVVAEVLGAIPLPGRLVVRKRRHKGFQGEYWDTGLEWKPDQPVDELQRVLGEAHRLGDEPKTGPQFQYLVDLWPDGARLSREKALEEFRPLLRSFEEAQRVLMVQSGLSVAAHQGQSRGPLKEWSWEDYTEHLNIDEEVVGTGRRLANAVDKALAQEGIAFKSVLRKGAVLYKVENKNLIEVDMYWHHPPRVSLRLPKPPEELGLEDPYPGLESCWRGEEWWGWTVPEASSVPDLLPLAGLASQALALRK